MLKHKHFNMEELDEPSADHPLAGNICPIDKKSVHRICSGQVVLTLATAVKELLENSIDAGATIVDIKLKDYGSSLIEVSDNGNGVHRNNFQGLTLKHHTSKLEDFSDLVNVETFGFRGEALSSLCALSDMSITTRHKDACVGTKLDFDHNGKIINQQNQARQVGTTVLLQNLFYTLPVRHKEFQRNTRKEFVKMVQVLNSYCIISTNVRISCTNHTGKGNRSLVVSSKGNPSMLDNISNVFGPKQSQNLLEFKKIDPNEDHCTEFGIKNSNSSIFSIEGYISKCDHGQGRSSTDRQFFFINGRPFDSNKLNKVVNEVYHQYNRHQYPFVALKIDVQRDNVDVNVTPDKRQVFLEDEKLIMATVKASLIRMYEPTTSILHYQNTSLNLNKTKLCDISMENTKMTRHSSLEKHTGLSSLLKLKRSFSSAFSKDEKPDEVSQQHKDGCQPKQRKLDAFVSKYSSPTKIGSLSQGSSKSTADIESSNFEDVIILDDFFDNKCQGHLTFQGHSKSSNDRAYNNQSDGMTKTSISFHSNSVDETGDHELGYHGNRTSNHDLGCHGNNSTIKESVDETGDHQVSLIKQSALNDKTNCKDVDIKKESIGASCDTDATDTSDSTATEANSVCSVQTDTKCVQDDIICVQNTPCTSDHFSDLHVNIKGIKSTAVTDNTTSAVDNDSDLNNISKKSKLASFSNDKETTFSKLNRNNVHEDKSTDNSMSDETSHLILTDHSSSGKNVEDNDGMPSDEDRETKPDEIDADDDVKEEFDCADIIIRKEKKVNYSLDCLKTRLKTREKSVKDAEFSRTFRAAINPAENMSAEQELQREIKKDMFSKMKILGQFNLGFIITKLEKDLFIVDQHATDEKYNFETLQRDYVIPTQKLICPMNLDLTSSNETILMDNIEIFKKNGFEFIIDEDGPPTQRVKLTSTPVSKNWNFGKEDIEEMIFMLTDSPGVTCRPSRVRAMFASRACRKSIMIGTTLKTSEMKTLVCHMGEIEQPWNCPHGRPTMRHLINLNMLPR
ncbi:hypothetical protein ACF0H5_000744 [Mactra antiquata]